MAPIHLAIVGVGKIVRDQHLPAVAKNGDYKLIAAASRHGVVDGIENFKTIDAMLEQVPAVEAVSLCMPPQYRYEAAQKALSAGKHVFLEKPPGATISEVEDLKRIAADIRFSDAAGLDLHAEFDWRQTGKQSWDIVADTEAGEMLLSEGGAKLAVDGTTVHAEPEQEYPALYRRFAEIIRAGQSDVDLAPLRHVADAFMLGRRKFVDVFYD